MDGLLLVVADPKFGRAVLCPGDECVPAKKGRSFKLVSNNERVGTQFNWTWFVSKTTGQT